MYIWSTAKTMYMIVIAAVQGMAAYGLLTPYFENEAVMAEMFQPFWLFSFGFILFFVESWWRFSDLQVKTFFALFPLRAWEALLMLGSIAWIMTRYFTTGFGLSMFPVIVFTIVTNLIFFGIYKWKAFRVREKS